MLKQNRGEIIPIMCFFIKMLFDCNVIFNASTVFYTTGFSLKQLVILMAVTRALHVGPYLKKNSHNVLENTPCYVVVDSVTVSTDPSFVCLKRIEISTY